MHRVLNPSTSFVVHHMVGAICLAVHPVNLRYRLLIVFDHPSLLRTILVRTCLLGVYVDVAVQNFLVEAGPKTALGPIAAART
jgi:hypothetical protein